jgi:magnesium transporter
MRNRTVVTGKARLVKSAGVDREVDADLISQLLRTGPFFWIDLADRSVERLHEFFIAMELDTNLEDHLLDEDKPSSFIATNEGICWATFSVNDAGAMTQVRGVFTESFLLTVHDEPCQGLAETRDRYERLLETDQDDGPLVLFMVLDSLTSTFEAILERLDARLDDLETATLGRSPEPGYVQQVLEIRKALTQITSALGPYRRDIVSILADADRLPGMQAGTQKFLDAHRSHVMRLFDVANSRRDATRDAIAAFSSVASEQQGEAINWLTIVAAVFLPLTFITGYFGMNFSVIRQLHGTLVFALLAVLLPILLVISTVLWLRFLMRRLGVSLIPPRAPRVSPPSSFDSATTDSSEAEEIVSP